MQFNVTKEWLQKKLAELEASGVNDVDCEAGGGLTVRIPDGVVVRAKMRCNMVQRTGSEKYPNINIQLGAVYSNDPNSENRAFANATPSATVSMNIDPGRAASRAFQLEGDYYVDFIPLGVQEYKYIGDGGFPPVPQGIIICKEGGVDQMHVYFQPRDDKRDHDLFSYTLNNERISESPWRQDAKFKALGYTHWRYVKNSDNPGG